MTESFPAHLVVTSVFQSTHDACWISWHFWVVTIICIFINLSLSLSTLVSPCVLKLLWPYVSCFLCYMFPHITPRYHWYPHMWFYLFLPFDWTTICIRGSIINLTPVQDHLFLDFFSSRPSWHNTLLSPLSTFHDDHTSLSVHRFVERCLW